jgi:GNAT superfamily N-acetyltransferase
VYANLSAQTRYQRLFTAMPDLPQATLTAAVEVDHVDQQAFVALPLLSAEIVGEGRFIRLPDQPGTAEFGVTVADAWQGRGLGSALLALLSERASEAGIEYFTAEVLAENRSMLALLPSLGQVATESRGPVVSARVELAEPHHPVSPSVLDLLIAAARGDIVSLPVLLCRLIQVPKGVAHIVRLPVRSVLSTRRPGPRAQGVTHEPQPTPRRAPKSRLGQRCGLVCVADELAVAWWRPTGRTRACWGPAPSPGTRKVNRRQAKPPELGGCRPILGGQGPNAGRLGLWPIEGK